MSDISENLKKIEKQLPEHVKLIAVSKTKPVEVIQEAYAMGQRDFGENRVQELMEKYEVLPKDIVWHLIGHLQTNKIKYLIGKIDLYHSCDRDELIDALAKQSVARGITSDILLQINIGNEETKGGYAYDEAKEVFARVSKVDGLRIKGFMAMLPDSEDKELLRTLTRKMRALFDWAKTQSEAVEYLSMGMSGDYKLCVEEGSNVIRVGSTIFGARSYTV